MAIYRIKHEREYFTLSNAIVNDPTISFKAKGILAYLLSKPNDWQVRQSDIAEHSTDGRDSVRSGINELIAAGYIRRSQERLVSGKFSEIEYDVSESPQTDYPSAVKPLADNPTLQSTDKQNTDYKNNNVNNGSLPTANDLCSFSFNPQIISFVNWYKEYYYYKYGKQHPRLKKEQINRIHDTLASFADEWGADVGDFEDMTKTFFERVESDHNINHFATEGILRTRYYDSGLYHGGGD